MKRRIFFVAFLVSATSDVFASDVSLANVGKLLAGRYDNAAQSSTRHGTIPKIGVAIESTAKPEWQLWRISVEQDSSSVEAIWAMKSERRSFDKSIQLVPYTEKPGVDDSMITASGFDPSQWLPLEACMLRGEFTTSRIVAQSEGEPCAAAGMGMGGKRALLPSKIQRDPKHLVLQIIYQGIPVEIDAHKN